MMDAEERDLLTKSIRQLCSTRSGGDLDAGLGDLGWSDALEADLRTAVTALFEAQGELGVTSGALHLVLAGPLGRTGSVVVLPRLGRWAAPGADGGFDGLVLGDVSEVSHLTVITDRGADVAVNPAHVELTLVAGMDPALGLVRVQGGLPSPLATPDQPARWADAVAAGQLALAHELIGATAAMLEQARTHAVDRIQFGVPIASFQAVRHKLADSYVALEGTRAAVGAAWDDGSPLAAGMAKAIAGRAARLVAKHCQQVLAGIGFTDEHEFHTYFRRVLLLDALLGDARSLTKAQGAELLRTRQLPAMLPL
jgi:hypothetical protein